MKTIYKYPLDLREDFTGIFMPKDSQILTLQMENNIPCIWVLVNPLLTCESRFFRWAGTGFKIGSETAKYVGTVQEPPYVWHLFEEGRQ